MRTHLETRQDCGHTSLWSARHKPPPLNARVFCIKCNDFRTVVSAPGAWTAVCGLCGWKKTRMRVETLAALITRHLDRTTRLHIVTLQSHEGKTFTIKLPDDAKPGDHSASVAAMARVLPPSTPDDTLF